MQSMEAFTRRDPGVERPAADGATLSRGLGVLSLGLGLTEIAAPDTLARAIGIRPSSGTAMAMRALGMRELVSGFGVLLAPRRALPLWARLVGDAIDLGVIGWAAKTQRTRTARLSAAFAAVMGVAALDLLAARRVGSARRTVTDPVISSVTINQPPAEVYAFWRRLSNLPRFMTHLESVTELDRARSRWVARLPVGKVEWDAELVDDRPGERIAWRTVEGSRLAHRGEVTFARTPGRDMTEVRVTLEAGIAGHHSAILGKLLAKPQIKGDLRRLKQVLETGEVLRSDASVHQGPHPAQPSAERFPTLPVAPGNHQPTAPKGGLNVAGARQPQKGHAS